MGIDYSYLEEVDMAAEICNLREVWVMPSTNETLSPWGEGRVRGTKHNILINSFSHSQVELILV
jgi:hypothetical protein